MTNRIPLLGGKILVIWKSDEGLLGGSGVRRRLLPTAGPLSAGVLWTAAPGSSAASPTAAAAAAASVSSPSSAVSATRPSLRVAN